MNARCSFAPLALGSLFALTAVFPAAAADPQTPPGIQEQPPQSPKAQPDLSGRKRVGKASFYSKRFAGHKMADGERMKPQGDNAASRTLPLGTTAKVTNIETGKSAVVKIEDRGPYVKSRIVDLSPATAEKIGMDKNDGVAKVAIEPIAVPLPNGEVKPGVAARASADR